MYLCASVYKQIWKMENMFWEYDMNIILMLHVTQNT
jgi:hypothetical protein